MARRPTRRPPDAATCYGPCAGCGAPVLRGVTSTGQAVTVEPTGQTYVVVWLEGTPQPVLHPSRGYPVHRCRREEDACRSG